MTRQASLLKVWTWYLPKRINFLAPFWNCCDFLHFNMIHFLIKMGTQTYPNIACGPWDPVHGWRLVVYQGAYLKFAWFPDALDKLCQLLQNLNPLPLFSSLRFSKTEMPLEHTFFLLKFPHLFWNSYSHIVNTSTYTWTATGYYKTSGWMVNLWFPKQRIEYEGWDGDSTVSQ